MENGVSLLTRIFPIKIFLSNITELLSNIHEMEFWLLHTKLVSSIFATEFHKQLKSNQPMKYLFKITLLFVMAFHSCNAATTMRSYWT